MWRCAKFSIGSFVLLGLACLASPVLAQAVDTEPNDTCAAAQDVGALAEDTGLALTGSLDTPPDEPDVDFFRVTATPGTTLLAELEGADTGEGTLEDPFLGLFDSACNLVDLNDDAGSLNSRLVFIVPDDGIVILAATSCCDSDFSGAGGGSGSYLLSLGLAPPPIGSIAGRVIDAISGEPLPGASPPFTLVILLACDEFDCLEFVNDQFTDEEGRFRFESDFLDQPLLAGTYQVRVIADEYAEGATEPFAVAEGEDVDLGDIALGPAPFTFSNIQPCADPLPQGDSCRYTVTVTNNTDAPFDGLAWSVVDGFALPSSLGFTLFEASAVRGNRQAVRLPVSLEPGGEQVLAFRFDVPASALGAGFCTEIFLGVNPDPLVTTIRARPLFCIGGTDDGFEVLAGQDSQKVARALRGRPEAASKLVLAKAGRSRG